MEALSEGKTEADQASEAENMTIFKTHNINFHWGGKFVKNPTLRYMGGNMKVFENIDIDYLVTIYVEEDEAEPLVAIDSQGNPIEKEQEEEIRHLLDGIDFEELDGDGNEIEGDRRKDFQQKDSNMTENLTENFTEIPVQQEASKMTDNLTENVTEKEKRKMYETFLNESSSEFDDSSDEDYVQSYEGSDNEAPSVVLEDIEFESDDDIFLSKDPSKKELIKKLKMVLKDKKNRKILERKETESGKNEWASEDENEDDLVENRDSWGWFVGELLDDIGGMGTSKWSFISDRQKAIGAKRARLEDFVDEFYTKTVYLKVYAEMIHFVPGAQDYIKTNFEPFKPPKIKKKKGRPKKLRRKGPNELQSNASTRKGLTHTCNRCLQTGHNKHSCKNEIHPKSKFFKTNVGVHDEIPQGSQGPPPLSEQQPSAEAATRGRTQSPQATQPVASRSANHQQVGYQGPRNASLLGNNSATSSVPQTRRYNKRPSISDVLDKMKERQKRRQHD
ncbi:UNVERIFIED_CONTAM: hypothetical protein Slati_0509400 [Sesamum latifolium]|uniref:PB1-like domain-containing protein n=1 Tax=Sesamum latifolium TaxID=2727402 RepID=A0AAW2Y012_9LAMI